VIDKIFMCHELFKNCKKKTWLLYTNNMFNRYIYKGERKTHPSFLRGWDVSDKR